MATRLYPRPATAAPVTPGYSAEWDTTTDAVRRACFTTKTNAADEYLTTGDATGVVNRDILFYQLVSPVIASGPIAGTVAGQFYTTETSGFYNLRSQMIVKVVSNDGATLRGVLYAGDLATLTGDPPFEWSAIGYVNKAFPRGAPVNLTSVLAQANDRVVIEVGFRQHVSASSTTGVVMISDGTTNGDLPNGDATDGPGSPSKATWVEFSDNLFSTRGANVRTWILE